MRTVIVADDLTGACDTAIALKRAEERAYVCLGGVLPENTGGETAVWALNTCSRPLAEQEAYGAVYQAVSALRRRETEELCLYKKIDSLFRGNVAAEIEAAAAAWAAGLVLLAPATPPQGRAVRDGRLRAAALPGGEMDLRAVLRAAGADSYGTIGLDEVRQGELALAARIHDLRRSGCGRVLVDGETEEDLLITAKAAHTLGQDVVLAGTSGFAAALRQIKPRGSGCGERLPPCGTPILFVLGSCHEVTGVQCAHFLEQPWTAAVWVSAENCLQDRSDQEAAQACARCGELLGTGVKALVLATDSLKTGRLDSEEESGGNGEVSNREITRALGRVVRYLLENYRFGAMLLSGGDTAFEILRGCGVEGMELIRELLPGVPLTRIRSEAGGELLVVTKSGSFGETDAFEQIYDILTKEEFAREAI